MDVHTRARLEVQFMSMVEIYLAYSDMQNEYRRTKI